MSTSLFEQLQRLKAPQTGAIADAKRKASILFDSKEAATKDRRTIYDLGINGLQDLIVINSNFREYKQTLFDENSLHLERAVEQKDINELLDKNIKKFLQHLSPYFLLRPAHLCLEWLIRRFQVHDYNRDDLMALVLPYHETNAFVKVIQTFRLKEADKQWGWLKPLQRPGKPLSKSAILNRAATDKSFLFFICASTLAAIKEMGPETHLLQTQINFYGSVVVGALENAAAITEWHISTLLPSLLKGLTSDSIDFTSAVYIIIARLVARTQLTVKLCNALLNKIALVHFERLRRTAIMLLIWIYDTQQENNPSLKEKTLMSLLDQEWLCPMLASMAKENIDVQPLCGALLKDCVHALHVEHPQYNVHQKFLNNILIEIEFPMATAKQFISVFLDCYVAGAEKNADTINTNSTIHDTGVIELHSEDEELTNANFNFRLWYTEYLRKLEKQYPTAFDCCIKEYLSNTSQDGDDEDDMMDEIARNRSRALKMALQYRLQAFDSSVCDIYENLYHHTASIRLLAVKTLLANLKNYERNPQNYQLLKECLTDRIIDDNEDIVDAVLELPSNDLLNILGATQFVEALQSILYKIQIQPKQWRKLCPKVVKHLCSESVVNGYDCNLIILTLIALFFPIESAGKEEICCLKSLQAIVKSPLAKKWTFLAELSPKGAESLVKLKKQFLDVISAAKNTPTVVELFESVRSQGDGYFKQAMQLHNFLMLVTACLKQKYSCQQSLSIFKQITSYCSNYKIKHLQGKDWKMINKLHYIPLQLFSDFLLRLTAHTSLQNTLQHSWENHCSLELAYFLNVFEFVSDECFNKPTDTEEHREWSNVLKQQFDYIFQNAMSKSSFLVNFYVHEHHDSVQNFALLRLRAFKLMQALVRNNIKHNLKLNTLHILKICTALISPSDVLRLETLNTLRLLANEPNILDDTLKSFVKSVLAKSQEISMDHEQFPLIFYCILKDGQKISKGTKIYAEVLTLLKKEQSLNQAQLSAQLLKMLLFFNDEEMLCSLLPMASTALQTVHNDGSVKMLRQPYDSIFILIIEKFSSDNIENILMDEPKAWPFVEAICRSNLIFINKDANLKPVPCIFLESLDERTFEKMPSKYKHSFLRLIIQTLAELENDSLFLTANKLLKKCELDCRSLLETIQNMYKQQQGNNAAQSPKSSKSVAGKKETTVSSSALQVNAQSWKQGIVLMELMENKNNLENTECLIPALFELLNCCLAIEEQTSVEYTKQLTLSALLHCCQKAKEDGKNLQTALPKTTLHMAQIVHCLRASPNPQTHNNALLLLCHCAHLFPQQVLHDIVNIFTFMGTSVVRHDDAFSFQIVNDIIISIVPILVKDGKSVIPVLKVFSDIMLDVPEHRRLSLYSTLLTTLGCEEYLWKFLCVVFEAHVLSDEKQRVLQKKLPKKNSTASTDQLSKRIEIIMELTNTFDPKIILETCIQLMQYIKQLPMQKDQQQQQLKTKTNDDLCESSLFNVNVSSSKQLRHYKYLIMQTLSTISSSPEFLKQIAMLTDEQQLEMKPFYQNFIIRILSYVPVVNSAIEKAEDSNQQKYWKIVLHHVHDVLDNAISLLSADMFLVVVSGLMQYQLLSIRKKVIELLNSKLQQKDSYFAACNPKHFHNLLQPLATIVASILEKDNSNMLVDGSGNNPNELIFLQQTVLIAVKLLSKHLTLKHIAEFKEMLANLTKITRQRSSISKIVLATVVLTMIEISSNLKVHCLGHLPKFMPHLIEVLKDQAELVRSQPPDNVCIAIVTGMQKLFEALPLFLGPYIVDIITALSSVGTRIAAQQNEKDQRSLSTVQKMTAIWSKIATGVPLRILVPACDKAYNKLMEHKNYSDINVLMKLLQQAIASAKNEDLTGVHTELTEIFMQSLEFRLKLKEVRKYSIDDINTTEESIINAFVAWVLKLSESSFRPLYNKLYIWALKHNTQSESILTYFLLTNRIAESLKSIFVLFARDFIEDAARLLNECNTSKAETLPDSEDLNVTLLKAILNTLYNIFLYDSKEFVNTQRFEYLMPAVVDQLENRLVLEQESLQEILSKCIAQLAVDVSNDVMWKQLNYYVLLKTRTNIPEIRIFAFNCCIEIARKLGDDFTSLLPETVPFIAELFEDENPRVEKNTRKSVQELEVILGESLQKYL